LESPSPGWPDRGEDINHYHVDQSEFDCLVCLAFFMTHLCSCNIRKHVQSDYDIEKSQGVSVWGWWKNSPQVSSFGMIWYLQPSRFLAARYTWAPSPWNLRAASAGSRIRGDWNLISRSGAKSIDWSPIGSNKNLAEILGIIS
jgi:hypothetical protein